MNLTQNSILQRIPELKIQLDSSNTVHILAEGREFQCSSHTLAILDAFSQPRSLSEALEKLQSQIKGSQDWMDLTQAISHLYEAGVLQDETQVAQTLSSDSCNYDSAPIHIAMLNDRVRTANFVAGIREVVRPGDVVVDIGTGTGILAVAAAQAGAKHVYAIEASGIGKAAKAIFAANQLEDRITLIEGWSTQIDLPERADVLVSEMIGNEPLAERVLEITRDAIKRLLKPDARLVPSQVKIFGLPVTIPDEELMKHSFTAETVLNWHTWYGINFSPLVQFSQNSSPLLYINPYSARNWKALSEPVLLADVDLKTTEEFSIDETTTVTASVSGNLNGVILYFELDLGPTTRLSTQPAQVEKHNHWVSPVAILAKSLPLQTGDQLALTYQYRASNTHNKVSISRLSQ